MAQLTEFVLVDNDNIPYAETVCTIGEHCRHLKFLQLNVRSDEKSITDIISANPELHDIRVSIGGAYSGVSIVSFLQFLINNRDAIKSLAMPDYLIRDNYMPTIRTFLASFLHSLESLWLIEAVRFKQKFLPDGTTSDRYVQFGWRLQVDNEGNNTESLDPIRSVMEVVPDVNIVSSGILAVRVTTDFAQLLSEMYGHSLRQVHFSYSVFSEANRAPLVILIENCVNLKKVCIDVVMPHGMEEELVGQLRTDYPDVEWVLKLFKVFAVPVATTNTPLPVIQAVGIFEAPPSL